MRSLICALCLRCRSFWWTGIGYQWIDISAMSSCFNLQRFRSNVILIKISWGAIKRFNSLPTAGRSPSSSLIFRVAEHSLSSTIMRFPIPRKSDLSFIRLLSRKKPHGNPKPILMTERDFWTLSLKDQKSEGKLYEELNGPFSIIHNWLNLEQSFHCLWKIAKSVLPLQRRQGQRNEIYFVDMICITKQTQSYVCRVISSAKTKLLCRKLRQSLGETF